MSVLELDGLVKGFGHTEVLRGITLRVEEGEILALLGPSGSGKTTLLRMIAGFEPPDRGRVVVNGEDVTAVLPARRRFGMVFQHFALFPHRDVAGNVSFGIEGRAPKARIKERVTEMLRLVDLANYEDRDIEELSGGQQQRVALARALAPEPRVLLLDEPLSNVDPGLRARTRRELRQAIKRVGMTTIFVTHEQEEAFELGDRIAVIRDGRIEQVGPAEQLYDDPASRFVATFVGRANELNGVVIESQEGEALGSVVVGTARWRARLAPGLETNDAVILVLRPELTRFAPPDDPAGLAGVVVDRRYTGPATYYTVRLDIGPPIEVVGGPRAARPGDRVRVTPRQPPFAFP
jgi:ABC-type Fe3+/spermidine/putrescine transport system ATPase subunit